MANNAVRCWVTLTGTDAVDLAVTQNGAETKLYQNVLGKPGLRVRLNGPPANPDGVGRDVASDVWRSDGASAGNPWRFGLLVTGQRGAGAGLSGTSHSNLDSLARRQDHHQPHSGWCNGCHGGHRWQADREIVNPFSLHRRVLSVANIQKR